MLQKVQGYIPKNKREPKYEAKEYRRCRKCGKRLGKNPKRGFCSDCLSELSKMYIRRNDIVQVISGEDKGKTGKVLKAFPSKKRVVVEGINFIKKHMRRSGKAGQQGGIIEKEASIDISNVLLYCQRCGKGVRVGMKITKGEDGKNKEKIRVCKKCGEEFVSG
jgi:large subunit ribosomal protein L24